jgi:hypothetical protein
MANKKIIQADLIAAVKATGAMNLIALTTKAQGTLCF